MDKIDTRTLIICTRLSKTRFSNTYVNSMSDKDPYIVTVTEEMKPTDWGNDSLPEIGKTITKLVGKYE